MDKSIFLNELSKFEEISNNVSNTPFTVWAKIVSLVFMNMKYEEIAFSKELNEHPYILTKKIIEDAENIFKNFLGISFIESIDKTIHGNKSVEQEVKH